MPDTKKPEHSGRRWLLEVVLGAVALAALIAVLQHPRQTAGPATSTTKKLIPGVTSTPQTFSNFNGLVQNTAENNLSVLFRGLASDGRIFEKQYSVDVNPTTQLLAQGTKDGKRTTSQIQLTDVKPNDTVFVSGIGNLAVVNSFTATKIIVDQQ